MSQPFIDYTFRADNVPTICPGGSSLCDHTLPERLSYVRNVRDFGATGDGVTDDWAAIMAAYNATAGVLRGTIFFPPGTYYVSQPIDFSDALVNVSFIGVFGASVVTGNFSDYIFKRFLAGTDGYSGCHTVENLSIINTNAAGGGIRIGVCVGAAVRNCIVTANLGINTANDDLAGSKPSQETSIENCVVTPGSNPTGSIGIMSVSDGPIINCRVTGCDIGIMIWGQEGAQSIMGCHIELCGIGLEPGQRPDGTPDADSFFIVSGCYFKNCGTAIIRPGGFARYTGVVIEAATGTIPGNPQYGIRMDSDSALQCVFEGVTVRGVYAQYGIYLQGGEAFNKHNQFIGCQSDSWHLPSTAMTATFIGCNVAPVYTMSQLPAFIDTIVGATWSAGTATITVFDNNLSPYLTSGVTLQITVKGVSPAGYNGTFTATATSFNTFTYTVSNPGGSGSSGSVIINPEDQGAPNAREGDQFNVSDANTATWGATAAGGSTHHDLLRWNGTNWTVMGV